MKYAASVFDGCDTDTPVKSSALVNVDINNFFIYKLTKINLMYETNVCDII